MLVELVLSAVVVEEAVTDAGARWTTAEGLAALLQATPPPSVRPRPATTVHSL